MTPLGDGLFLKQTQDLNPCHYSVFLVASPQGGYLSKIAVVAGLGNIIITVYILFIGMHFQQKYMLSFFPI